jgi:putative transferase (TIGR04331 family)
MFESARLQVFRDTDNHQQGNVVYLDWWSAGTLKIDDTYQKVINFHLTESDSVQLDDIEHSLFEELVRALNQLHKTDYPVRFWRIFVGAWHQEFFFTLVDRFNRLLTSQQYARNLTFSTGAKVPKQEVLQDATHFPGLTGNIDWESCFLEELVNLLKTQNELQHIELQKLRPSGLRNFSSTTNVGAQSWAVKLVRLLDPVSAALERRSMIEVADTYLSVKQELFMRRRIGNFSFLRLGQPAIAGMSNCIDETSRALLSESLESVGKDTLSFLWTRTIPYHLPLTSIENFNQLAEMSKAKCDRYMPQVFFTSNRFGMSDTERIVIAEKVRRGCKYLVAQHGNNYGVTYRPRSLPEEETADIFFRWSKPSSSSSTGIGVITSDLRIPRQPLKPSSDSLNILVVGSQPPARTFRYYDWDQYFESEQQTMQLVSELTAMGHAVKFRPYKGNIFGGGPSAKFVNWFESPKVAKSVGAFRDAIAWSHMTVFMYDSTGFLELVSRDFPTLQIQSGSTRHVSLDYLDLYAKMNNVGLLHESVDTAIEELRCPSLSEWWNDPLRHSVRNEIKERLAFNSPNIAMDLAQKLLESLES